jgi:hypothetical protein
VVGETGRLGSDATAMPLLAVFDSRMNGWSKDRAVEEDHATADAVASG